MRSVAQDGNLPVQAEFQSPTVSSWHCAELNQRHLEKTLHELAASTVVYQVGPHGEVGLEHRDRDRFTYQSAVDLLNKVALDLLQTRLADRPVSLGSSWKPHGQFTYWKDYLLSGLDVSAASIRWKSSPKIAGRDCASITSKLVDDEALSAEQKADLKARRKEYEDMWAGLRPQLEEVVKKHGEAPPPTCREVIARLLSQGSLIWNMGKLLYDRAAETDASEETTKEFMDACPPLPLHSLTTTSRNAYGGSLPGQCREFTNIVLKVVGDSHAYVASTFPSC